MRAPIIVPRRLWVGFALGWALTSVGCGSSASSGTGSNAPPAPAASLTPANLTFASENIGSTSSAQSATLTNTSNAGLAISSISASGDFAQTNNCPASLAAGLSCTIQVTFAPTATGTRTGTLTVHDNASGSPQSAGLTGIGTASGSSGMPNTFFGITVGPLNSATSWPVPVPFGTSGKATGGSYWFNLEPSSGTYDWTPLDNLVNSALNAGITNIMYTFFETPQWASSNPTQSCAATQNWGVYGCAAPPADIDDWNNFVTALVTRYKGKITYYEPWNEPDVSTEYSGTIAQMLTLAQNAYQIIKSIDPGATVLTPSVSIGGVLSSDPNCGSSTCWLAAYLAAGGGSYADGVGFHGKACDTGSSICVTYNIACPSTAIQQCAGTPLINQIADARTIMANNGLSAKTLINTEGGYTTSVATNDLSSASADQQSAYVSRFFILQASENLPIAVWFSWLQDVTGFNFTGFGTTAAEAENNQAYQQTYNWLVGSTMNGPCSEEQDSVWACPLTLASGQTALIVWSDSATSYTPVGGFTSYVNLSGNSFPISGPVPIGIQPILLE
jgi:Abnormal spindle-like microcephaly-assoc'd, ASPM-SPD-2-Hydin